MKNNLNNFVKLFLFVSVLVTIFNNCSIQTPQAAGSSSSSVGASGSSHVQGVTSCVSCHENTRPTYLIKTSINLSLSSHFNSNDCYLCHTYANLSWTPFVHQNADGKKVGNDSTGV
mgnify:CR=1 FL=1